MMISKSSYTRYDNCPKSLWLHFNKLEETSESSPVAEKNMKDGNEVGELAKQYFPSSYDASAKKSDGTIDYERQLNNTKRAIENGEDSILEASFAFGDLFCAVDILKKDGDGYSIYEVKSNVNLSDKHFADVAFQAYVLRKTGIKVNKINLMIPNKEYKLHGSRDVQAFFKVIDLTENKKVLKHLENMDSTIESIRKLLSSRDEISHPFSNKCGMCEFSGYCFKDIPKNCVGSLKGYGIVKSTNLYNKNIITIDDLFRDPSDMKDIKDKVLLAQLKSYFSESSDPIIDKEELRGFLDGLKYPIYHLDFETTSFIIPVVDGMAPGESFPYQYSLHIEEEDGTITHKEFLADRVDCIEDIARSLIENIPYPLDGTILAYSASVESNILKRLASKVPMYAEHLHHLSENVEDLEKPFARGYYYSPKQGGSTSIKVVMPALVPEMADAYNELDVIHNGAGALSIFESYINMGEGEERKKVRKGMLDYCCLDTLSMVRVLQALKESVK